MGSPDALSSYVELADLLDALPLLLREARRGRRLSLRDAGTQIGIAASTVMRIENGDDCALSNATAVLRWLDQVPDESDDQAGTPKPPPDTSWLQTPEVQGR